MTRRLILCSFALLLPAIAFAMAAGLDLETALRDADLIARIKVVSTKPAPAGSRYKQLALATMTESIKGSKAGETIQLLSDNGSTCPNVLYAANDDCIIFARRTPEGYYETMNTYAGQFRVRDGLVEACYLFYRTEPELAKKAKPEAIISAFRRIINTPKK
jgi:hypothetical protein